ncbi:hypothetical protein [Mucilaginibacter aquariorum]|uniref:Uncharacterized protein n=1 Tax=Mucilaginibacter aquariorum TaxID=2967225 RepID=A0ABT1SZA8_9SPHI|nr:hypothetical protein [Mucilaginibacter aquariorum]MCQ6957684.1 hypothetical protein [Mucilaginibacter aquariorum]
MIIATSSLELTRTDGTKLYVDIEPVTYQEEGKLVFTGVYQLQATRHDDPAGEYTEDNPGDTTEIGTFAHKQDNKFEWVYLGDFLDEEEQSQVADHLQRLEDKDAHTAGFYVQAFYHGGMNSFEVKAQEGIYAVAYDGKVIAELEHNHKWEQVSGDPLEEDVFVSVKQAIEAKFEKR